VKDGMIKGVKDRVI